jgi:hypothetical protein
MPSSLLPAPDGRHERVDGGEPSGSVAADGPDHDPEWQQRRHYKPKQASTGRRLKRLADNTPVRSRRVSLRQYHSSPECSYMTVSILDLSGLRHAHHALHEEIREGPNGPNAQGDLTP